MLRDMQFSMSWTEIVIDITKQRVIQINLLVNKTLLYKIMQFLIAALLMFI